MASKAELVPVETAWDHRELLPRATAMKKGDKELAGMTLTQLEAELATAKKSVSSLTDELREVMVINAKLIAELS